MRRSTSTSSAERGSVGPARSKYNDGPIVALVLILGINLALYLIRLEYSGALDDDNTAGGLDAPAFVAPGGHLRPPAGADWPPAGAERQPTAVDAPTDDEMTRRKKFQEMAVGGASPPAPPLREAGDDEPKRLKKFQELAVGAASPPAPPLREAGDDELKRLKKFKELALPDDKKTLGPPSAVVREAVQASKGFGARPILPPVAVPPKKGKDFHSEDISLPAMYGQRATTIGLEHCAAFRAGGPAHTRRWAPAGMFNCGTNTLLALMRTNCQFTSVGRHTLWQVPWGKHNPVSWRKKHWARQFAGNSVWKPALETVMPIVVIKDPLTWMKSMCRNQYASRFRHSKSHTTEECPSPVDRTQTTVYYQPTLPQSYESLVHFWAEWNEAWLNVTFPRLVVRFEDILFDSEGTITTLCECLGGTMKTRGFRQSEDVTKDIRTGHRGKVNDREAALKLYSSEEERYRHYTAPDLEFAAKHASKLTSKFDYGFKTRPYFADQRRRLLNSTRPGQVLDTTSS